MARRFVRPVGSRLRTRKTWGGFTSGAAWVAVAGSQSSILGSFVAGTDVTVLRTRGLLSIRSDQEGIDEEVNGALGLAVVSEDAFGIGVTAVPTPIADIGSDAWLMWMPFSHAFRFAAAVGLNEPIQSMFTIDSKAMRKFHADERVVVVIENEPTVGFELNLMVRQLVSTGKA